jgi:hypothetical protein
MNYPWSIWASFRSPAASLTNALIYVRISEQAGGPDGVPSPDPGLPAIRTAHGIISHAILTTKNNFMIRIKSLYHHQKHFFKQVCFACILVAGCYAGNAQAQRYQGDLTMQDTARQRPRGFDPHKLFVGGTLGLSFGDMTYLNLSPSLGYRFSELFAAGVQINAQYESVRYHDQYNALYKKGKYGVLGAGIFGRIYPIPQLFIHLQPEMNFIFGKVKYYDGTPEQSYREHVPSFLAGAGYEQPFSANSAFTIMILYDVLQRTGSPYGDQPVFRAGVNLGL